MGRKRNYGRPINGVLLIDKSPGMSSNTVVQRAKRLYFANKAGHTGALDPLATGVLPVCLGEATKFSQYLLDADKSYESVFCLGVTTETGDADGAVLHECDASGLSQKQVDKALDAFRGAIQQVPPMYSALKRNGQPLYKLARAGIEVEREARSVVIHQLDVLSFEAGLHPLVKVSVTCSKGTYIRSLAEDLGRALDCGAHVVGLRRTRTGDFDIQSAVTLEQLEAERGEGAPELLDHHLLAMDAPVASLPMIELDSDSGFYFARGQAVMDPDVYRIGDEGDTVRVFRAGTGFMGLGEITDDGRVAPKRLVVPAG